jgi:hypothetical protein
MQASHIDAASLYNQGLKSKPKLGLFEIFTRVKMPHDPCGA